MRSTTKPITLRELRRIVFQHGGVVTFAAMLPVDPRTVRYWLSGERAIRPVIAERIRSLAHD
jgi:hypothetical protein